MNNMKIVINAVQPLKEVVKELERLGYVVAEDSLRYEPADKYPSICSYEDGKYVYYCHKGSGAINKTVTLTELRGMI